MNYIYEAEGKNKAEAEKKALDVLGLKEEDVTFRTPENSRSGLLGIVSRKPVTVQVVPNESVPFEAVIRGVVLTLIEKMGIECSIETIGEMDGNILVEVSSEDSGILIGKQGRTMDSLQFLVNLLLDSKYKNGKRIMLDIANYREKRQRRLSRMAKTVADKVFKSKRSVALEYMNPYERRIVHLALEEDDRVFTRSDGNGVYKRVRILPAASGSPSDADDDTDSMPDYDNEQPEHNGYTEDY